MENGVKTTVENVIMEPYATLLPEFVRMVARTTGFLLSVQVTTSISKTELYLVYSYPAPKKRGGGVYTF